MNFLKLHHGVKGIKLQRKYSSSKYGTILPMFCPKAQYLSSGATALRILLTFYRLIVYQVHQSYVGEVLAKKANIGQHKRHIYHRLGLKLGNLDFFRIF